MKNLLSTIILLLMVMLQFSNAQRSCGSMEHLATTGASNPAIFSRMAEIEEHTQDYILSMTTAKSAPVVITIPVVVHVVYNTTAENISDAQINSQIAILNADFRKLNADASLIPSTFTGVAADAEIEFCLAQRTSTGAATTGIVRVSTTRTSFSTDDAVKSSSTGGSNAWPSSSYLNVWVCDLGSSLLGYAQFPGGATATDGVVCNYTAFGNTGTATAPFNKGRTVTHEVGHWLNLRHIWGDATCGSDLVSDTPIHNTSNGGCPTYPHYSTCSGTPIEMTMNYMDYTDDACMYMFTAGQKTRMQALFASGGSRASLTTSLGCTPPSTTSCATVSGLNSSSITTSSATITWTAVSGATSYNIQYKTSAATTWTTTTSTTTSKSLSGLAAGTTYNYRVQAVCSTTSTGSYSSTSSFTTSSTTTTCATPSGLTASSISSSSATLSWAAVSGATSYNIQYKTSAATTWTTTTSTTTSKSLSGLIASTTYNFKVQAVCSSTSTSAYATAVNFTTTAASTTCTDGYEPNNTSTASATLPKNTNITAKICTSTDQDWYIFTTTTTDKKIKINLSTLPADYDVVLFNSYGTQVGLSENAGTTSEQIIYNAKYAGTYYVAVYGYGGVYSTSSSYTLRASTQSTAWRLDTDISVIENDLSAATTLFPNPTIDLLYVNIPENILAYNYKIININGSVVMQGNANEISASSELKLNVMDLTNGSYIICINTNAGLINKKFIIVK